MRVYPVVEGVGGHAEEVGDGVVHVGAECVDGVADAEVAGPGDAEGAFCPGPAVVEVADMVAAAPADVVQPRYGFHCPIGIDLITGKSGVGGGGQG